MVRDGYIYGLSFLAVVVALSWATGNWAWSIAPVLLAAFFLWFFRDPERAIPSGPGLIARRIVFNLKEGDLVERGQRVGLIKFGSRVDVLLPAEAEIRVKVGQKVNGGASVLAFLPEGERL